PHLVKNRLVFDGRCPRTHGELRFPARSFPEPSEVVGNVVGDRGYGLIALRDLAVPGHLALEVGLLLAPKASRHPLEPGVHPQSIDFLNYLPALIDERNDGLVTDRLIDGVCVNDAAKTRRRTLLGLHQRRSGESDVT